jgi:phospholipid/cholesterol/gamma-HCH transport system substrate-binding protein
MRKDCQARELTMEIIVGAFVVMVFLGLAYFTIILSRETWFGDKQVMEVVFDDVMGLRDGDSVVVRGMTLGKVKELDLLDDGVHVIVVLDHPVQMREDYRITIVSTSILGGRYLQLDEGSPAARAIADSVILRGEPPYDLMADAAELMNAVKRSLVEGGVIESLRSSVNQINEIITRVNEGKGVLGKLFSADETLYSDAEAAVGSLKNIAERLDNGEGFVGKLLSSDAKLYDDLSAGVASLRALGERLEKGEGTLGKLMGADTALYDDLSATVASLKEVGDRLAKGEGTLGRLMSSDDTVYKDLADTVAALKSITSRIEQGEGALGKLIADETLYDEVDGVVKEVRAAVDDFRETTPIVTFTSIFFGAF